MCFNWKCSNGAIASLTPCNPLTTVSQICNITLPWNTENLCRCHKNHHTTIVQIDDFLPKIAWNGCTTESRRPLKSILFYIFPCCKCSILLTLNKFHSHIRYQFPTFVHSLMLYQKESKAGTLAKLPWAHIHWNSYS